MRRHPECPLKNLKYTTKQANSLKKQTKRHIFYKRGYWLRGSEIKQKKKCTKSRSLLDDLTSETVGNVEEHNFRSHALTVEIVYFREPEEENYGLVDNGSSYGGSGYVELMRLHEYIMLGWSNVLDNHPYDISKRSCWQ